MTKRRTWLASGTMCAITFRPSTRSSNTAGTPERSHPMGDELNPFDPPKAEVAPPPADFLRTRFGVLLTTARIDAAGSMVRLRWNHLSGRKTYFVDNQEVLVAARGSTRDEVSLDDTNTLTFDYGDWEVDTLLNGQPYALNLFPGRRIVVTLARAGFLTIGLTLGLVAVVSLLR